MTLEQATAEALRKYPKLATDCRLDKARKQMMREELIKRLINKNDSNVRE